MEYARNIILFLFEQERKGYKRNADCTVYVTSAQYKPSHLDKQC